MKNKNSIFFSENEKKKTETVKNWRAERIEIGFGYLCEGRDEEMNWRYTHDWVIEISYY